MVDKNKQYEYFAFISYKREDEKWAKWLQRKLEYYKLPSTVRKDNPNLPDKIRPVFKDTTDLEPGVLAQKIQNALNASKFLIVICSPRSANSVWVSKEVQSFINSGRTDQIIPFIIGGTPNATDPKEECFPEGLRQLADEQELLGANINEMGREAAAIKVITRMFDLRFDSLWQRYEKETNKKLRWTICIAVLLALLGFLISGIFIQKNVELKKATQEVIQERDRAETINAELVQSKDSLAKQNGIMTSLNNHLKILSDSVIHANKILAERNRILSRGRINTKQIFNYIKSRTKDNNLLSLVIKEYQSLGETEALFSNRLVKETEHEVLMSSSAIVITRENSINKFRNKVQTLDNSTFL